MDFTERAIGAVVGSAVGDALGAPFEFGPEGAFSARFPAPDSDDEMCGGRCWEPGEATDDTQMAVLVADSLLDRGGLDLPDVFERFRHWAASGPKDIGLQTEAVLTDDAPWDLAAALYFQTAGRAAGNGSLMRAAPAAVYFARQGRSATMDAARRIAALTHGDRAAWEGTAVYHELIRLALNGHDPLRVLPEVVELIHPDHRSRYAVVLDADWHPDRATEFNGAVWPCLGSAVWALRTTTSFEHSLTRRCRPRRRHRHRRCGDGRTCRRRIRPRRRSPTLDGTATRADPRLRRPGATPRRPHRPRPPTVGSRTLMSPGNDERPPALDAAGRFVRCAVRDLNPEPAD